MRKAFAVFCNSTAGPESSRPKEHPFRGSARFLFAGVAAVELLNQHLVLQRFNKMIMGYTGMNTFESLSIFKIDIAESYVRSGCQQSYT
jgi:hypothetical protein